MPFVLGKNIEAHLKYNARLVIDSDGVQIVKQDTCEFPQAYASHTVVCEGYHNVIQENSSFSEIGILKERIGPGEYVL